jgi:acetyl-CoA carboxylase carboxyl transferase subunit beta
LYFHFFKNKEIKNKTFNSKLVSKNNMAWFKRTDKGIQTSTEDKKDTPKGLWYKTPSGKIIDTEELKTNLYVSPEDGYHVRIGSKEYFELFFDKNKFTELDKNLTSKDPLNFEDTKKYPDRLKAAQEKTKLKDAVRTAVGKSLGKDLVIAAMDFSFIGGSMGSVVGEKIARAIDYAIAHKLPFLMISKSGGARMMEASLSLMQLVKTSTKLAQLAEVKLPYISLCTDPTTGGTTASYAMLGDINIAEPNALIGFAGPRVVKDTTGKDLPEGFQKSEFVLEHGFLDAIYERKELKKQVNLYIDLIQNIPVRS